MAERRMFAKTIIDSDAFLDMPLSSQALYFHLSMRADDDGFNNNPKKVQRMIGASDDDLKLLVIKKFIIPFDNGIIVIKHWKIHNYIQKDRYRETVYQEEKSMLQTKENKAYTLCIQDGYSMDTQVRIGKDRKEIELGEVREDISHDTQKKKTKPQKHKYGEYQNVLLSDDDLEKLKNEITNYEDYIEKLSSYMASTGKSYKNHLATIRNWARKDKEKPIKKTTSNTKRVVIDEEEKKLNEQILRMLGEN